MVKKTLYFQKYSPGNKTQALQFHKNKSQKAFLQQKARYFQG